jgi:hypothetical protein
MLEALVARILKLPFENLPGGRSTERFMRFVTSANNAALALVPPIGARFHRFRFDLSPD